jgi:hypothetical protein
MHKSKKSMSIDKVSDLKRVIICNSTDLKIIRVCNEKGHKGSPFWAH